MTGITYPSTATNSFVYNGEDLRVSKTDSAGTSAVITDGTAPASPVLKDARAVYTPGLSERTTGTGAASKFYHGDALGSTRGITNASQAVTDAILFDAFGMTVSRTGTTATPFGFVGAQQYQSDADSGLQLLGHRYYDPSIGRFISSDPAKAGTNWHAYTSNGPLRSVDPMGLWNLYHWLYTGDGNSSNGVYDGAVEAGSDTLIRWWGHFSDRNRRQWPWVAGGAVVGTIPYWPVPKLDPLDGARDYSSVARMISLPNDETRGPRLRGWLPVPIRNLPGFEEGIRRPILKGLADEVGSDVRRYGPIASAKGALAGALVAEAVIAWQATGDTMRDPVDN